MMLIYINQFVFQELDKMVIFLKNVKNRNTEIIEKDHSIKPKKGEYHPKFTFINIER